MPARRPASSSTLLLIVIVAGCGLQLPAAGSPSALASMTPVATPSPAVAVTPSPEPDPPPTQAPSPTPDPFVLDLDAFGCEGGVVLEWTPSSDPDFHHYVALRSPQRRISTKYPPIAPAVDWGDTYATDRFVTSAVDASVLPSLTVWHYRVMAYDGRGRVIGASPVRTARLRDPVNVGPLEVEAGPDETTRIAWIPYRGMGRRCFSAYRVLVSIGGGASNVLTVVSDQDTSSIETGALHSGMTYQLRVEAVRTTLQGSFVIGQTEPVIYTVP